LPGEEWRVVEGKPYEVSHLGNVRRVLDNGYRRYLKPVLKGPYYSVTLVDGRDYVYERVHRLVAKAFLGPVPDGKEVNHKDGNKFNNRVDNLEYLTHKENLRHAADLQLCQVGEKSYAAKLTNQQVREIREALRQGVKQLALSFRYGVSQGVISDIGMRRRWRHLGD